MSVPWRECESGGRRLEVTFFDAVIGKRVNTA